MHTSCAACRDDDGLCAGYHKLFCLHVHKNSTGSLAVFIKDKLDCGGEVNNGYSAIENLVTERSHYFRAGIVLCGVHTLARRTAAVSCYHCAVGSFIKFDSEIVEPLNGFGSVADELFEKLFFGGKVTAAESIKKMDSGGIAGLVSCLNSALCHHGVCVAYAEFRNYHSLCADIIGFDSCGSACSAAADYKNVNIVCYV